MPRFQHTSRQDPRQPHVGICQVQHDKNKYDEEGFKTIYNKTKEQMGNCDAQDRNYQDDGYESDPEETLQAKFTRTNLPNAITVITEAGEKYTPSCAAHASNFRDTQLRNIADLQNIRPDLNEGESNEARWHFSERSKKFLSRANQNWNSLVKLRRINNFNSGTENVGPTPQVIQPKNTEKSSISLPANETPVALPVDLKGMLKSPDKYNGWLDDIED